MKAVKKPIILIMASILITPLLRRMQQHKAVRRHRHLRPGSPVRPGSRTYRRQYRVSSAISFARRTTIVGRDPA